MPLGRGEPRKRGAPSGRPGAVLVAFSMLPRCGRLASVAAVLAQSARCHLAQRTADGPAKGRGAARRNAVSRRRSRASASAGGAQGAARRSATRLSSMPSRRFSKRSALPRRIVHTWRSGIRMFSQLPRAGST